MAEHISTYIQDHISDLIIYETEDKKWKWIFRTEASTVNFASYEQCLTSFILYLIIQSSAVSKEKK